MPELHTRPRPCLLPIRRPDARNAKAALMLAAIVPGPEGFELRTFECRKCDHSFTKAVAKDPMNAVSARWIAGELKPPT